jgi:large subunit ribosomal protein L23
MKDPRDIIIAPVVSEKSYGLIETGVYTFRVHPSASKPEIRQAIESIWGVEVRKVNTLNRPGKKKRTRGTNRVGSKPATKRAIVTLASGEIPLFEN